MKKPIILALLLIVISTATFAGNKENLISPKAKFQVVENSNSRYDLYYVSETADNVRIRILDADGNLVTTDKLQDVKAFKRTYNLSNLPSGNYAIEVKNNEGKASQTIFHNPAIETSLHSILGKLPHQNKFKLFVAPSKQNNEVEVKIYDDKDNLLTTEKINGVDGFSKVFNLTKLKNPYVVFKVCNGTDEQSFVRYLK